MRLFVRFARISRGHGRPGLRWCWALALIVLTTAGWAGLLDRQFAYSDDLAWLVPAQTLGPGGYALHLVARGTPTRNYRPVAGLGFLATYLAAGCKARGYVLMNLLLHVLNSCLLYCIVRRVFDGERVPAVAAAALFAAHPVHIVDLRLISDGTLLATLFSSLALLVFSHPARRGQPSKGQLAASVLLFALGLLSKECGASLPVALAAHAALMRRRGSTRPWRLCLEMAPFLAVLAVFLAVDLTIVRPDYEGTSMYFVGWHVPRNLIKAIMVLLCPVPQVLAIRSLAVGAALLLALAGIRFYLRRDSALLFCMLWIAAMSLPGSLYADYWQAGRAYQLYVFAYPSAVGLCAAIGVGAGRLWMAPWARTRWFHAALTASSLTVVLVCVVFNRSQARQGPSNLRQVALTSTIMEMAGCDATRYLAFQQPRQRAEREYAAVLTFFGKALAQDELLIQGIDFRPFYLLAEAKVLDWKGDVVRSHANLADARAALGTRPFVWHHCRATDIPNSFALRYIAEQTGEMFGGPPGPVHGLVAAGASSGHPGWSPTTRGPATGLGLSSP